MLTEIKYFSPMEAKKTLPLVKMIVDDIISTSKEVKLLVDECKGNVEDNPSIMHKVNFINKCLRELEEIGCYYKDWNFEVGLVDFPSVIDNQEVFLCWRSDEADVLYYHGMESGYTGRKMIPQSYRI